MKQEEHLESRMTFCPPYNSRSLISLNSSPGSSATVVRSSDDVDTRRNDSSSQEGSIIQPKEYKRSINEKRRFKIVQVVNIAAAATDEQIGILFSLLGRIEAFKVYPVIDHFGVGTERIPCKICFVKFVHYSTAKVAQHLSNTVFKDRVLLVMPYFEEDIPDEYQAMNLLAAGSLLAGLVEPKLPDHVVTHRHGGNPELIITEDPRLAERGLPPYPPLLASTVNCCRKIEEIRRTVIVCNLSSKTTTNGLLDFFSEAGEVKYLRLCSREKDTMIYALIEFTEQASVLNALELNGRTLDNNIIKMYHSSQRIIKPEAKTGETIQQEIEDAMLQNQALAMLNSTSPVNENTKRSRSNSRSRSRGSVRVRIRRTRSRSRSRRSRRRHSRSRSRRRRSSSRHRSLGYYSYPRRYRSRSRSRGRREKRRSRSKSRETSSGTYYRSYSSRNTRSRSPSVRRDDKKGTNRNSEKGRDGIERSKSRDDLNETSVETSSSQDEKKTKKRRKLLQKKAKKQRRSSSTFRKKRNRSSSDKEKDRSSDKEKKCSKKKKKKVESSSSSDATDSSSEE